MPSVASVASRLSLMPVLVGHSILPRFPSASSKAVECATWEDLQAKALDTPSSSTLPDEIRRALSVAERRKKPIKVVMFGEQHHQPRVLAAQLQLLHTLSTLPQQRKITVLMEHFSLLQQPILSAYAEDGDLEALVTEYEKGSEGFRIAPSYWPILHMARESKAVQSEIRAGFPPREWARFVMRGGKDGLFAEVPEAKAVLGGGKQPFDEARWEDLKVSREYAAYIKSSISATPPDLSLPEGEIKQGGLNAAQAFKDSIMAWQIGKLLSEASTSEDEGADNLLVVFAGAGHCEYSMGVMERIKAISREEILLVVTKPLDGQYWYGIQQEGASVESGQPIADLVVLYEPID